MKVFVTGGTGFIGQALIKRLIDDGWQVTALARSREKAKKAGFDKVKWYFGDICDTEWHQSVLGADVFVHLVGVHGYLRLPYKERLSVELEGTKSAVSAAKKAKISHFIHLGTAYTDLETEYARAKKIAQRWLEREMKKGFPATIVCPVTVYGPGDLANLHRLFIAVAKSRFFFIGRSQNAWQLVYIDDLIEFLMRILKKRKEALGKVFVLTNKPVSLKDFVKTIAQEVSVPEPKIHLPERPMLMVGKVFSFLSRAGLPVPFTLDTVRVMTRGQNYRSSKVKKTLGFRPRTDLRTGIRRTVKWYQENNYW